MNKRIEAEVKKFMTEQLKSGVKLTELQALVNEKFQLRLSYLDLRILSSTLKVDWNAHDPAAQAKLKREEAEKAAAAKAELEAADAEADAEAAAPGANKTVVEVNKVSRPGVMYSGTVKFASGSTADWYVDQTGRPGLENLNGAPPSREDAEAFMVELQRVLR